MKQFTVCGVFMVVSWVVLVVVTEIVSSTTSPSSSYQNGYHHRHNSNTNNGNHHHPRKHHHNHHHHHHHHDNRHNKIQQKNPSTSTPPGPCEWDPANPNNCPHPLEFPDYSLCSSLPCEMSPGGTDGPICGSDGLVYDSRCILEREACILRLRQNNNGHSPSRGLEVDESGRKCPHFLIHPFNKKKKGEHQFNPGQDDEHKDYLEDGIQGESEGEVKMRKASSSSSLSSEMDPTPNPNQDNFHLPEGEDEKTSNSKDDSNSSNFPLLLSQEKSAACEQEDFQILKAKLFHLNEMKWVELTGQRIEEVEGTDPRWKEILFLADGPEALDKDKDHLIQLIFSTLDSDANFILNYAELYKADVDLDFKGKLGQEVDSPCQWRDFLRFQDTDGDDRIHVTEFYAAFSHLYGVTMISLEKALEFKTVEVRAGEDVRLRCDIRGSPPTPVMWTIPEGVEEGSGNPHMKKELLDGSLTILSINERLGGNYSCKSPRNMEVVQVHRVIILMPVVKVNNDEEDGYLSNSEEDFK